MLLLSGDCITHAANLRPSCRFVQPIEDLVLVAPAGECAVKCVAVRRHHACCRGSSAPPEPKHAQLRRNFNSRKSLAGGGFLLLLVSLYIHLSVSSDVAMPQSTPPNAR